MTKRPLLAAAFTCAACGGFTGFAAAQSDAAQPQQAFTGNIGLASEYRYRGIAQTDGKPALQGGFDYAHTSGLYLGTWASNVSWLSDAGGGISNSLEWDLYGGFKRSAGDFAYEAGLLYYAYPGRYPPGFNSPDSLELYLAGSWKTLTLKYSHALTDLFGFVDSKGAGYLDLAGSFDLGGGIALLAHVGHQRIPAGAVGPAGAFGQRLLVHRLETGRFHAGGRPELGPGLRRHRRPGRRRPVLSQRFRARPRQGRAGAVGRQDFLNGRHA